MKIGLKLLSTLMVLPLVMGVQKHRSDSLYTDLTIGAGGGSYSNTFYTRTYTSTPGGTGCDGSTTSGGYWTYHENREKISYKDAGIGLETMTSKKTKIGIRLGYIKDTRIEVSNEIFTSESKTSYIINPHFSFEFEWTGFGAGALLATGGLYYPSFKKDSYSEDYFTGNDRSKEILPSFHLRLGSPKYLYASVSHLENIPIVSGGGYVNYGVGTEAIPYLSLWAGYCEKRPFEKGSFLLKGGLKLSRSLSLNFAYRPSVETQGMEIYKPIKENAFSVRLNYRFFR